MANEVKKPDAATQDAAAAVSGKTKGLPGRTHITQAELEVRLMNVQDLLIAGYRPREIWRLVTEKQGWIISHRTLDRYIAKATTQIREASAIDRKLEMGKAKKRLDHLYQRNLAIQDFKAALAVVREANALYGLTAKEAAELELLTGSSDGTQDQKIALSALQIAPSFYDIYRDIEDHNNTEYVAKGGRGSTKSSFVSLVFIELMMNNPTWHGLATRQVANTMRDSVYSQLMWAIGYLGVQDKWSGTTSPLEITYIPTGQKIYFRGGDNPMKIKSIKPKFGFINILWFEELDQFHGANTVRSIVQSALRGGGETGAYMFKTFNPPRTINNWVHKELAIPKPNRYVHSSDYTTVPKDWLGQAFVEEAEILKTANPDAYEHEYLGKANSAGGMIFENVQIRKITDEEIYGAIDPTTGQRTGGFDRVLHGLDWGYYPDPAHYSRVHFDAARRTLYIFGEVRRWKVGNRELYDELIKAGLRPEDPIICDSSEPKSVADFREYGSAARGAEKGADSVTYSIKWLQSLAAIIIDNERAPYAADEFLSYEYERSKDDEIISAYPDENNHAIDSVRYATNRTWARRGQ